MLEAVFLFQLSGIAIIVAGAVIQIKWTYYINFLGDSFFSAPILLIVVGCIIALLGFFGCCGAIRENYCMTMTVCELRALRHYQAAVWYSNDWHSPSCLLKLSYSKAFETE